MRPFVGSQVISDFDATTLRNKALPPLLLQLHDDSMLKEVLPALMALTQHIDPQTYPFGHVLCFRVSIDTENTTNYSLTLNRSTFTK